MNATMKLQKCLDDVPKHNDPFDRLLICQSKAEGMRFLTHDSLLSGYREE